MRPLGRAVRPTGRTALHTVLDAELWKALAEAKAMNSSDSILPKIVLGSGVAPLVVLKNETNLPGVKTFAYWSNQGAGLRAKIRDE
jgi:hypothetical protein